VSARTFFGRFFDKFTKDDTNTLAASLAFYTALSLAPLLILFVAVTAHLSDQLQAQLLDHASGIVGAEAAQAIQIVIEGAKSRADLTGVAGLLGALTLLVSASLIFGQLRNALNRIFEVPQSGSAQDSMVHIVMLYLRERLAYVVFALIGIASVIISLAASSVISASIHSDQKPIAVLINVAASMAFYSLVFTMVFRYLPDKRQAWLCAFKGGVITATLFVAGKELIGMYLGRSAIGSAYGAAGSLIVLLVWVYYSSLITFVGAQVSSILMWKSAPEYGG
jgi:membrane protein